ncbi:putative Ig domain-containing protein [Aurantimicrobium minutum]|uniref:putative Ig domain-containing protein n=1 Tax=Aurantimicrobium TaxID=1705353 RepID=UPI003D663186
MITVGLIGTVSYAVTPTLPQGLSLNTSTGVITGTTQATRELRSPGLTPHKS